MTVGQLENTMPLEEYHEWIAHLNLDAAERAEEANRHD